MQPSVCILKLWCTPHGAWTHLNNWLRLSDPMILLSFIISFRYCKNRLNFSFPSLVLLENPVHSNDILGQCRAFYLFLPKAFLQLWSVGCPHLSFIVLWNSHLCYVDHSLPVTIPSSLAPPQTNKFIPQCNTSQIKIILCHLRSLCPLPVNCVSSPLILWGYQTIWLLFQSFLCLLLHQHVIPCYFQNTMLLCIACIE